ncbi:hypothetical protein V1L52_04985 [Treponema sp. HNW]|uniref:hypothetical protein n=1 Tax=Treponema sp. HNW TaxID=3116654 RepID=UPI003D14BE64
MNITLLVSVYLESVLLMIIDIKIYQAIHPILSSNEMRIASTVIRSALKFGTNIDFNQDGKNDMSLTLGGLSSIRGRKIKNIAKRLIVVDDFERALLEPCKIFGYFSEIITNSKTKVIFIGNEEKISEENFQKKQEYLQIKEKAIGIEFEIEPDIDNAIRFFVNKPEFKNKDFFVNKTTEIIKTLNCINLRTVWQALYNLHLFIVVLGQHLEDTDQKKIYEIFLILYIQKNLEEIHKGDPVSDILSIYLKHNSSYKKIYRNSKNRRT